MQIKQWFLTSLFLAGATTAFASGDTAEIASESAELSGSEASTEQLASDKQQATLSLYVFDGNTPVQDFQLIVGNGVKHQSNSSGGSIFNLPAGKQAVMIFVEGYQSLPLNLDTKPGEFVQVLVTVFGDDTEPHVEIESSADSIDAPKQGAKPVQEIVGEPGVVKGRIVSSENGQGVKGAHLYFSGTSIKAVTDSEGYFQASVPPTTYSISVIHRKFSTQTIDGVAVKPEETVQKEIELTPAGIELKEYVVLAPYIQGSVASLVDEKKNLAAAADVLGAEQISRSGDSSAAGALSRVAGLTIIDGKFAYVRGLGDRYSQVLLNGAAMPSPDPSRRAVPLDLFPSRMIQNVVVRKTYTPDMPGEFGGGVVQIRTKGLPEDSINEFSASLGYNSQTTGKDILSYEGGSSDWLGYDDGHRELPTEVDSATSGGKEKFDKQTGFNPAGLNPAQMEVLGESFNQDYDIKEKQALPNIGLSLVHGNRFETKTGAWGYYGFAEYKNKLSTRDEEYRTFGVDGAGTLLKRDEFDQSRSENEINLNFMANVSWDINENNKLSSNTLLVRTSEKEARVKEGVSAENGRTLRKTELNWEERQFLMSQFLGEHEVGMFLIDWRFSYGNANRYAPDNIAYRYDFLDEKWQLQDGEVKRNFADLEDTLIDLGLDVTLPLMTESGFGLTTKAGFASTSKKRDSTISTFDFKWIGDSVPSESLMSQESVGDILSNEHINGSEFEIRNLTAASDAYDATWGISAFYGMMDFDFWGALKVSLGARVEQSDQIVNTADPSTDAPVESNLSEQHLMPAFNMTLPITGSMNIRFAYSETVSRPDLKELAKAEYRDPELGYRIIGNPDLQIATIQALDFKWEWYLTSTDTISASIFSKDFTSPVERIIIPGFEAPRSFENAIGATNTGWEVDFRKTLDFISSESTEWFVSGNYASITSEVELGESSIETDSSRPLQGQADYTMNFLAGVDYEPWGSKATLLYNVVGEKISEVGAQGVPNVIEQPAPQLDFVYKQDLSDSLKMSFKMNNILNPERQFKQEDEVSRSYKKGMSASLGVKWVF